MNPYFFSLGMLLEHAALDGGINAVCCRMASVMIAYEENQ